MKATFLALAVLACSDRSAPAPTHTPAPAAAPSPATSRVVDERSAFDKARAEHKGVMIVFEATWCTPCVELARNLRDSQVAPLVGASFVPLTLDVSNATDRDLALQDKYGAKTLPHIVFVAGSGDVLGRVDRLLDPPELAATVRDAAAKLAR